MNIPLFKEKDYATTYAIPNFLTNNEINELKNSLQKYEFQEGGVWGNEKTSINMIDDDYCQKIPTIGNQPNTRKSIIKWIEHDESTEWFYDKVIDLIKVVNGTYFNLQLKYLETLQYSIYRDGGFYKKHNDCGDLDEFRNYQSIRKLSFSIQLSDSSDYVGGDVVLDNRSDEFKILKDKGSITFFRSNMNHEVLPVLEGERESIVGWVVGPNVR